MTASGDSSPSSTWRWPKPKARPRCSSNDSGPTEPGSPLLLAGFVVCRDPRELRKTLRVTGIRVRHALRRDLGTIVELWVDAFSTDPYLRWIQPDDREWPAFGEAWMTFIAELVFERGHTYLADPAVVAVAWIPPDVALVGPTEVDDGTVDHRRACRRGRGPTRPSRRSWRPAVMPWKSPTGRCSTSAWSAQDKAPVSARARSHPFSPSVTSNNCRADSSRPTLATCPSTSDSASG